MTTHRSATHRTIPFSGPVAVQKQNPAAHGNVTVVSTCRCGAERRTNVNGQHSERGEWVTQSDRPDSDPRSPAYIRRATQILESQLLAGEPLDLSEVE